MTDTRLRPATGAADEIARGERFAFGDNWRDFAETIDAAKVVMAERSLQEMLGSDRLDGASFLDVGCGSGLFSLAAHRLGAIVRSFDFDPVSVETTAQVARRFGVDGSSWRIERGSILDDDYLASLGTYDIVYAWGVLHHTGDLWKGLDNAISTVKPGGLLYIAIYNDQGVVSEAWTAVKQMYARASAAGRSTLLITTAAYFVARSAGRVAFERLTGRSRQARPSRGMSLWYDIKDWVGGYPFEVAKPEEVFDLCRARGFNLRRLRTCSGRHGCNEFVFERAISGVAIAPIVGARGLRQNRIP